METNELPEEVRRKIEYGANLKYTPGDRYHSVWRNGAEFGYRLALQSKEEELSELRKIQAETLESLNRWIENCHKAEEQLKAKDEENKLNQRIIDAHRTENERLREALKEAGYFIYDVSIEDAQQGDEREKLVKRIDTLLSQSTDKSNEDTKVYLVSSGCLFEGGGTNAVFSSHDLAVACAERMAENKNRTEPAWDDDYKPMTKVAVDLWKNDMDFISVNAFGLDPSLEDLVVFESTDKP